MSAEAVCPSVHLFAQAYTVTTMNVANLYFIVCTCACNIPGPRGPERFSSRTDEGRKRGNQQTQVQLEDGVDDGGGDDVFLAVLLCSLAVLDPSVGHTIDVLSPFISVLLSF